MLLHYLELAWRNTRAAKGLSALMVLALGLGIGACMTTLTVYHVLSGDPIPHKSARLFNVQLDAGDMIGWQAGQEPTFDLTRYDATALLRDRKAPRQAMSSGFNTAVGLPEADAQQLLHSDRYTAEVEAAEAEVHKLMFPARGGDSTRPELPIVENWFMASVAGGAFVTALAQAFDQALDEGAESVLARLHGQGRHAAVTQALDALA